LSKTTKKTVEDFVAKLQDGTSIEIDTSADEVSIILDAPPGRVWNESGCHISCGIHGHGFVFSGKRINWTATLADVISIIDQGTELCDDEDCDACGRDADS